MRTGEIKRNMEAKEEVYGDALFVTAVCWMKTGPSLTPCGLMELL